MLNKLKAMTIKAAQSGVLQDGGGLMLKKSGETGKWVYRYSFQKKRRDMGLGSYPTVTLAAAREERDRWARVLASGRDPVLARDTQRAEEAEAASRIDPTFAEMTDDTFEAIKAELRGDGERGRWMSPMRTHVLPKIGHIRISQITKHDIVAALQPIWHDRHPTAIKAFRRTKLVMTRASLLHASVRADAADAAKLMLGAVAHQEVSITSTPWQDIPALFERLGDGTVADCLRLMMLTAVRMDPARGLRLDEIDGDIWTIPADRMKGSAKHVTDFRVPLSDAAIEIIERNRPFARDGLLFAMRSGRQPTSRGIEKRLDDVGEAGRPHGLRTSFRTWIQDTRAADWDVAETALAHKVGGKVARAYARSDLIEERRPLMQRWANYVVNSNKKVIPILGKNLLARLAQP